jgi:membrane protein DedA with SNARE-associated domain
MLDQIIVAITGVIGRNNNPIGLVLLGACALLEYVFPPFPGDSVTLFGSVLVVHRQWSLPLVFMAVMVGSAAGAMLDYWFGSRVGRRYRAGGLFRRERSRARIERVLAAFRRYGPAYVAINRFLPGVRAVIFVAAGMAGLQARWVLFYALVSAALWNTLILALGYLLGANWDQIRGLAGLYGQVIYAAIALVVVVLIVRWWLRRSR